MKILLVSPDYPPPFVGGSLVYVYNLFSEFKGSVDILTGALAEGSAEVTREGHRTTRSKFITPSRNPTRLELLVTYFYTSMLLLFKVMFNTYDAVVVSAGLVGNCLFIVLLKMLRIKTVGIAYAEELTIPLQGKGLKNIIKRFLLLRCYKYADGFISVCGFTKNVLISVGVKAEYIEIIPPMISEKKSCGIATSVRRKHLILSVGRLVKRKGFNYLIGAVKLLKKDLPDIHLIIIGNGDERTNLLKIVHEYGIESDVSLLGQVSDEKLGELYSQCDVFVLANIKLENGDCEGAPTVFLEASAYGKPVIGGIEGGADAVIDNGKTGYVLDPKDLKSLAQRIKELLLDSHLAVSMGMEGKRKIDEHHTPVKASEKLDVYLRGLPNRHL